MNLLLDTHIFLWAVSAPESLPRKMHRALTNPDNSVFVSSVSAWEVAVKKQLGKLDAPADLFDEVTQRGMSELPLRFSHARELDCLPPHHGDPFDRMLIAQAIGDDLVLVSNETLFDHYGVRRLW